MIALDPSILQIVALGEHMSGEHQGSKPPRADFRHAFPVFVLVAILAVGGLVARAYLVPDTFGEYGYYRATAMEEEQLRPTHYAGQDACEECHDDVTAVHAKDVHASVQCETCHGPGLKHIDDPDIPMQPANRKEDCLVCHRRLDARPGSFPQVTWIEHFKFVGVTDTNIACVRCHSGHEPLFTDHDLREARLHPLIQECADCHIGLVDENTEQPANHPRIFHCADCHPALTASFNKDEHRGLRCTTCHLFIKENNYSGRIVRNADPRFCLLCHRKTDFKLDSGTPKIDWPAHLTDVADDPVDPKRSCTECHQFNIHDLYPKEKPHVL